MLIFERLKHCEKAPLKMSSIEEGSSVVIICVHPEKNSAGIEVTVSCSLTVLTESGRNNGGTFVLIVTVIKEEQLAKLSRDMSVVLCGMEILFKKEQFLKASSEIFVSDSGRTTDVIEMHP